MISFVVPAYNEEKCLAATLQSIHGAAKALSLEYEIVVSDDASTDATASIARQHGAHVIPVSNRQIARTRNDGARAATGDRLVFVDADTLVAAPLLKAAMEALDAGAVGGGARPVFEDHAPGWAHFSIAFVTGTMRVLNMAAGCFIYCRRDAFEAVGGFDPAIYAGEEIWLSQALKKRGRFVMLAEEVVTSPRKFTSRGPWQTLWLALRLMLRNPLGVKRRGEADFWYDGRR